MKAYLDFWKRWNDFKGRTSRHDYFVVMFANPLLLLLATITAILFHWSLDFVIHYFIAYELLWLVPLPAMMMRRLRDAGYSKNSFLWLLLPGIGLLMFFIRLGSKSME